MSAGLIRRKHGMIHSCADAPHSNFQNTTRANFSLNAAIGLLSGSNATATAIQAFVANKTGA